MITRLDHIMISCSSEEGIRFYEKLGFTVTDCIRRERDQIYLMDGLGTSLEIFVDENRPRNEHTDAYGVGHIAFMTDDIEQTVAHLGLPADPILESRGLKYTFVKDPDQTVIELVQKI